jgi:hypothetical protein
MSLALGVALTCCFSIQANAQQTKAKKQDSANQKKIPDKPKAAKQDQAPKKKKQNPVMAPIEDVAGLPRVLLIGDSISIGYTLQVRKALEGKANVHRPPTNCGPSSKGLEGIDQWLGDKKWDAIHFNFGLHDLKYLGPNGKNLQDPKDPKNHQQVPPEEYEKNLRKLVERLQKTNAKLIWRNTTPVPEGAKGRVVGDSVNYNAIAAKVMKDNGIDVHDVYALVKPKMGELMQPKGNVHFNKDGSQTLAQDVAAAILKALGS